MPAISIPRDQGGKWSGIFPGFFRGNLWKTHSVDLEKQEGKILLSKRMVVKASSATLANLGVVDAFLPSDADATQRFWALSSRGRLFKTNLLSVGGGVWSQDALSNTPTEAFDILVHETFGSNGRLLATKDDDIAILNSTNHANAWVSSWWKRRAIASSTDATPIEITTSAVHGFSTGDTIRVSGHETNVAANGTWVITVVNTTKFTLDSSAGSGAGAGGTTGNCGYLNQPALTVGFPHPGDTFNRLAIIGDRNFIHTIDRNDAVENQRLILPPHLAVLHIFHTKNRVWILCQDRYIAGRGSVIEWDGFSLSYLYEHPVYANAAVAGCDHNNSPVILNSKGWLLFFDGAGFSPKRNVFFLTEDQMELRYGSGTSITVRPRGMMSKEGLVHISVSSDPTNGTVPKRMNAGVWVYNPETDNLYHKYSFSLYDGSTDFDFGQLYASEGGALLDVAGSDGFFASSTVYTAYSGSTQSSIHLLTSFQNSGRGYFVTTRMTTAEAQQMWSKIWAKFKKFTISSNRIIVKARGEDPYETSSNLRPYTATITWVSTTSFTGVLPTGVAVGDEVEILAGHNAGVCTHITVLSATPDGAATITVTVDAVPYASTSAALARFDNWKKLGTVSSTSVKRQDYGMKGINSEFAQLKIEFFGAYMEFDEAIIESETNQRVKRG